MKNFFIILFSMLIVFAYASADNAVSPLVTVFHNFYHVPEATVLYLISSCTFGIVLGTFIGPAFLERFTAPKVLVFSAIILSLSTIVFIRTNVFLSAVFFRFIFGFCCGLLNCIIWWVTFHGVSKKTMSLMIVMVVASRPIAMALGIPLVGIITSFASWQIAYTALIGLLLLSTGALYLLFQDKQNENRQDDKQKISLLKTYREIFKLPYSRKFYFGLLLNSFCYFGFYAFAGIWFLNHYDLNFLRTSFLFLLLGGIEVSASFIAAWAFKNFSYRTLFLTTSLSTVFLFPLFIYGYFSLTISVVIIMLFILTNRAVVFAMIRSLPIMFSSQKNKTPLGALVTLSMWTGFALVSGIQGKLIPHLGVNFVGTILFFALIFGVILMLIAQKKMVFFSIEKLK